MVRCLIRLIEPTAGDIVIAGEDITGMGDKELIEFRRNKIAMVFQHYGLMPHRNVIENAGWGLEVQRVKNPNATLVPATFWPWWAWPDGKMPTPANFPGECSSASAWPVRWP